MLILRQATLRCLGNQPDWANYGALYPRGVERTRDFFSKDIVTAVHALYHTTYNTDACTVQALALRRQVRVN